MQKCQARQEHNNNEVNLLKTSKKIVKGPRATRSYFFKDEDFEQDNIAYVRQGVLSGYAVLMTDQKRTWIKAREHCRSIGGDLPSLHHLTENDV
jgi:hypothetical protein